MTSQELTAYCIMWAHWCRTRKYFAPPVPPNILAQLQPRRRMLVEPDGPMSPDMAYFNMAVHSLAEVEPDGVMCFTLFHYYGYSVKAIYSALNIGRQTFYDRLDRFANRALKAAATIKRVHLEHLTSENCTAQTVQFNAVQKTNI